MTKIITEMSEMRKWAGLEESQNEPEYNYDFAETLMEERSADSVDGTYKDVEKQLKGMERQGLRYAEKTATNVANKLSYLADDLGKLGWKDLQKEAKDLLRAVKSALSSHQIGKPEKWKGVQDQLKEAYKRFSSKKKANEDVGLDEAVYADARVPVKGGDVVEVAFTKVGYPGKQPYLHAIMKNGLTNSYAAKTGNHVANFFMKMRNEWNVPKSEIRNVEKALAKYLKATGYSVSEDVELDEGIEQLSGAKVGAALKKAGIQAKASGKYLGIEVTVASEDHRKALDTLREKFKYPGIGWEGHSQADKWILGPVETKNAKGSLGEGRKVMDVKLQFPFHDVQQWLDDSYPALPASKKDIPDSYVPRLKEVYKKWSVYMGQVEKAAAGDKKYADALAAAQKADASFKRLIKGKKQTDWINVNARMSRAHEALYNIKEGVGMRALLTQLNSLKGE